MTTPEELKAEIERLKRDNEALKKLKHGRQTGPRQIRAPEIR